MVTIKEVYPMELNQLRAFVKVAQLKSYTRAAEALHLTQPAISHQIASLEDDLGCRLLEQVGKKTILTAEGERLLPHAERVLRQLEEAETALEEIKQGEKGRVSIAAIGSSTIYLLPDIIYRFRLQWPEIDIILRTAGGDEVKEMVANGTVDLGILGSHVKMPETAEFTTVRLFEDKIGLFVNPRHPLAKKRAISFRQLAAEPLIQLGTWQSWQDHVLSIFRKAGLTPQIHLQLDSIEAVKRMVQLGLGYAIIPYIAARRELKSGQLVPLKLKEAPALNRDILLIYRKDRHLTKAFERFIEFICRETQNLRF
jgi:DNA-binding transcriptional LysR family regulator